MTLCITHIDKEFMDGGFELVIKWIKNDLLAGHSLEEIYKSCSIYTFGAGKNKLTEDQFFLAYKSAELVFQDILSYKERKKSNQMFRRR